MSSFFVRRLEAEQLLAPFLYVLLNGLQTVFRQIDLRMPPEGKADETAELSGLHRSHHLSADTLKADAICGPTGLCVTVQIPKIFRHGEVKQ